MRKSTMIAFAALPLIWGCAALAEDDGDNWPLHQGEKVTVTSPWPYCRDVDTLERATRHGQMDAEKLGCPRALVGDDGTVEMTSTVEGVVNIAVCVRLAGKPGCVWLPKFALAKCYGKLDEHAETVCEDLAERREIQLHAGNKWYK